MQENDGEIFFLAPSSYKKFFYCYTGVPAGGLQDCGRRKNPLEQNKILMHVEIEQQSEQFILLLVLRGLLLNPIPCHPIQVVLNPLCYLINAR